jgi:hypothetical protein
VPTIKEKVIDVFQDRTGEVFLRNEIIDLVCDRYPGTNRKSVIPSDYCYNIVNAGIDFDFHLFESIGEGRYRCLGLNYPYHGDIYWRPVGQEPMKVGEWEKGKFRLFKNAPQRAIKMIKRPAG